MTNDLNLYQIENADSANQTLKDCSVVAQSGTEVYFRNIERKLIEKIKTADAVFGAIAWLTNYTILDTLASLKNVSIIVQKEDFLRPDVGSKSDFKNTLRKKYDALSCELTRYSFNNILSSMSVGADPSLQPIRCVGNHNKDKKPAFPRMHNKFLVFAKVEEVQGGIEEIQPFGVWTGSFNLTKNAGMSLENAVYFQESEIVKAYFEEYGQIAALSEELDWESEWSVPEWRIGT